MSELKIKDLTIAYKNNTILENVNLTFETGHCYALLGRNGSGKSTLIKTLLENPKQGEITLDGEKLYNNQKQMSRIYCMSQISYFPGEMKLKTILKIMENVAPNFDTAFANEVLKEADIDLGKRFSKLSLGTGTLVKAVLAIATGADFIFLDEPELGVDAKYRELFYEKLAKRMAEQESCFVIATHNLTEFTNLPDRVIVLHERQAMYFPDAEELIFSYAQISGKKEQLMKLDMPLFNKKELGNFMSAIVKVENAEAFMEALPKDIDTANCNLQEIFLAITDGKSESMPKAENKEAM